MAVRGSNYIRPVAEGHGQGNVLEKLEAQAKAEHDGVCLSHYLRGAAIPPGCNSCR